MPSKDLPSRYHSHERCSSLLSTAVLRFPFRLLSLSIAINQLLGMLNMARPLNIKPIRCHELFQASKPSIIKPSAIWFIFRLSWSRHVCFWCWAGFLAWRLRRNNIKWYHDEWSRDRLWYDRGTNVYTELSKGDSLLIQVEPHSAWQGTAVLGIVLRLLLFRCRYGDFIGFTTVKMAFILMVKHHFWIQKQNDHVLTTK